MTVALLIAAAALGPDLPLEEIAPRLPFAPEAPVLPQPMLRLAPQPPGLPGPIRTMIEAAYKTGNDKTISDVVGLAKDNFPTYIAEIDNIAGMQKLMLANMREEAQQREQARIMAASLFQIWKGELEAGGSRSTGTTRTTSIYAGRHTLAPAADGAPRLSGNRSRAHHRALACRVAAQLQVQRCALRLRPRPI
jgi:hypothetical protein